MLFLCSIQFGSAEAGGGPGSVSVVFPDLLLVFRSGSTQLSYGAASSSTSSLYPSSRTALHRGENRHLGSSVLGKAANVELCLPHT